MVAARTVAGTALAVLPEAALTVVRLLAAAVGEIDPEHPGRAGDWLALVPHVRAVVDARGRLPGTGEEDLAECAAQVALALSWAGRYAAALDLAQAGMQRDSGLGADSLAGLALRQRHAEASHFLGQAAAAEAEYRQILGARLRVQGPDHPDTLMTWHDVADTLMAQGQHADAEAEYRQLLYARLRVLGPEHRDTLATRHEMAHAMSGQGRHADAEAEFRQILDVRVRVRVRDPDHPDILATRNNIAFVLAEQGRHADAEAGFRQVLDGCTRILGPDHPGTLTIRNNLARALASQGRHADAEAGFRQVLDARLRILGPDHPHTLTTREDIRRLPR
jgi:tetratricopeptide (TPR) repeat protein